MSWTYYMVDKENKALVRIGKDVAEFREAVETYKDILSQDWEMGELQERLNQKRICDLTANDTIILYRAFLNLAKLLTCFPNTTNFSVVYAVEKDIDVDNAIYCKDYEVPKKYKQFKIID